MRVVYSPAYRLNLGAHVFPIQKYQAVAGALLERGIVAPGDFISPEPCQWPDLALVHTPGYLSAVADGSLTDADVFRLEIPVSPDIVEGFRLMTGGTVLATRLALAGDDLAAVHIGGGFHHAFADHGEGFCLFNDVAVSLRVAFRERLATTAAVIDLDVHHGNGTAAILGGDRRVFTLSLHEHDNYPAVKPPGSLDIGLPHGADDDAYLAALEPALARMLEHLPDVAIFLAGADPYVDDQLGGLALTVSGLRRRDRLVLSTLRAAGVPVVVVLAGGYARRFEDTVAIHVATIEEVARLG
ncbi:MAG: histone deacetylase [Vicinamibacterales bacterium]